MSTVIRVENLGKKYIIRHQQQGNYQTLREVISEKARDFGKRVLHPLAKDSETAKEEFWALKDVSFEVKQGDRLGIIGRNGAGKSTLLKVLSRITEPTTGRITIKGRVASLLEVGTGFHPELTGRENIYLNGAILGMSKTEIKKKFDEIVAFSEVEKFLDTPVKRYSSGMYVRLAFAVAAHLEPEILIVDEVLAVGDAQFQKKCLGKMEDISAKGGRTILFVSHNIGAINKLCSKAILLQNGVLIDFGTVNQVVDNYLAMQFFKSSRKEFQVRGDLKAQVLSVNLIDDYGNKTSEFECGKCVNIELEYIINTKVSGCHVACILTTMEGYHIFSTADTDADSSLFAARNAGIYKVRFKLPTNFLNTGKYNIAISIGIPNAEIFDRQEALSFSIIDNGDFGSMKEGSRRAGLFLYEIPWKYF